MQDTLEVKEVDPMQYKKDHKEQMKKISTEENVARCSHHTQKRKGDCLDMFHRLFVGHIKNVPYSLCYKSS
ncbi:Hypothetical predicted protein [Octopus vulgaris]|uniref:Uncharacterized protein n=1 Tax=Octopus vulgaris TaxID=6645 RepID=A0AA36F6U1_OCTVU|nr:Hypothetical predicted protein [Octopus vulgaris]